MQITNKKYQLEATVCESNFGLFQSLTQGQNKKKVLNGC